MKENQSLEFLEGENRSYDELTAKGNEFHFSILEQKLKELSKTKAEWLNEKIDEELKK